MRVSLQKIVIIFVYPIAFSWYNHSLGEFQGMVFFGNIIIRFNHKNVWSLQSSHFCFGSAMFSLKILELKNREIEPSHSSAN